MLRFFTKSACFTLFFAACTALLFAQTDTTTAVVDDFSAYGDADTKVTKNYCNQKVNYLTPTKLISIGFERQEAFGWTSDPAANDNISSNEVSAAQGLRLFYSTPVVSRTDLIVNLALSHWETGYRAKSPTANDPILGSLDRRGLRSTGLQATVFKPFNEKNFIIVQAQADLNGNYRSLGEISGKALTYSATAIYGWKKNDNLIWGLGAARTYRLGQLIYVPVLLWNKTFNERWGIELLLPAKGVVRRNFGTTSLVTLGLELEGNAYHLNDVGGFLRRGELKPRITYERQIKNFIWFTAQAGLRYNARFNVFADQNPTNNEVVRFENTIGNPLFFNIGIHLVSP
jgi:Domain of unknown function (DUF6268)